MQQLILIIFFSSLLISCKSKISVDELCRIKSLTDGKYATYKEVLYLIQNNDTVNMEIDTMYFKVDKKTENRFKLKNRLEYEVNSHNANFDIERYIYLKPSNHHESAWNGTLIIHMIPQYTDWIKCICTKDFNPKIFETIKKQLIKKGYQVKQQEGSLFVGEFKDTFIKYQKENNLPYGNLNVMTLKSLGIRVLEK